MYQLTRPLWAEINLDNLAHNMREVRRLVAPGIRVTAVIKADGYGHGAVRIGQTLLDNGADRFAVATLSEGRQLRRAFPNVEILVLGHTPEAGIPEVVANRLIQTVFRRETVEQLSAEALRQGAQVKVHVKIDTGMSRLGFQANEQSADEICQMAKLKGIDLEGVFSHFAKADEIDKETAHQQAQAFNWMVQALETRGLQIPIKHLCNSAGIMELPEYHLDMVRAGIMLYGLYPSDEVNKETVQLKPVMALKAQITHVKSLAPGRGISYGHKYVTSSNEQIATLPLGYADGYTRILNGKAQVSIQGKRYPVVGNICMDQCMIRVDDMEVKPGDLVTIYGGEEPGALSVDEIAAQLGTINYEVVCMVDKRVPRVYMKDGVVVDIRDYVWEL